MRLILERRQTVGTLAYASCRDRLDTPPGSLNINKKESLSCRDFTSHEGGEKIPLHGYFDADFVGSYNESILKS